MSSVNKVIIVGNLGADPDIKILPAGGCVTKISVATSQSWKDKTTGESHNKTEWHKIVFYNRLAEIAGQYLKKGAKVYVEGSMHTNKWTDKEGQERITLEIKGSVMQMLDSKNDKLEGIESLLLPQMPPKTEADFKDDDIPF